MIVWAYGRDASTPLSCGFFTEMKRRATIIVATAPRMATTPGPMNAQSQFTGRAPSTDSLLMSRNFPTTMGAREPSKKPNPD